MPLKFNGNTPETVTFNGNDVEKVIYNGVTVWEKEQPTPTTYTVTYSGLIEAFSPTYYLRQLYVQGVGTYKSGSGQVQLTPGNYIKVTVDANQGYAAEIYLNNTRVKRDTTGNTIEYVYTPTGNVTVTGSGGPYQSKVVRITT